jgi:hypothetical protein
VGTEECLATADSMARPRVEIVRASLSDALGTAVFSLLQHHCGSDALTKNRSSRDSSAQTAAGLRAALQGLSRSLAKATLPAPELESGQSWQGLGHGRFRKLGGRNRTGSPRASWRLAGSEPRPSPGCARYPIASPSDLRAWFQRLPRTARGWY